ncbi:hypothetical protein QLG13_29355 (plasmid) [Rhodococcus aetherivorans]|uniref:hypothetical protein n=1 Tax=Rhodococcus aetherivorans TaxID=191292 RepID=UPI003EBD2FD0
MANNELLPDRGAVFWPVGTGDSSTIVLDDEIVMQVDLHALAMAQDDDTPHVPVVDRLVEALPVVDGVPYLAVFALTHADMDHCLGFEDLLSRVRIGELWATPRMWREFADKDAPNPCPDAKAFQEESERRVAATKKAIGAGEEPDSGDRILVIGYDTDHDSHASPGPVDPARVRRGFPHIRRTMPTPDGAPKPSRPGPPDGHPARRTPAAHRITTSANATEPTSKNRPASAGQVKPQA